MKKNIVFSMCASLLFLASCDYNKDNFPGYDELAIPKDVQNVELSLADGCLLYTSPSPRDGE
mgnify:CR=1 FL=1